MIGENFKRFYSGKKILPIKVSKKEELRIRSKINKIRNELNIEYLDLTIPDKYLEDKENKINELIDSLY